MLLKMMETALNVMQDQRLLLSDTDLKGRGAPVCMRAVLSL